MSEAALTFFYLTPWILIWAVLLLGWATIFKWLYQVFQSLINTVDHGHFTRHS